MEETGFKAWLVSCIVENVLALNTPEAYRVWVLGFGFYIQDIHYSGVLLHCRVSRFSVVC